MLSSMFHPLNCAMSAYPMLVNMSQVDICAIAMEEYRYLSSRRELGKELPECHPYIFMNASFITRHSTAQLRDRDIAFFAKENGANRDKINHP